MGARSSSRVEGGIKDIAAAHPSSKGRLGSFVVDLADLETIKPAVEEFLSKEQRLDVLVLNAGVMMPPAGSKSKQGYDLELGTNCLGHFLLTSLLSPLLRQTAQAEGATKSSSKTVRVLWLTSMLAQGSPKGGVIFDESGAPTKKLKGMENYMQSKCGDTMLAAEWAKKLSNDGIISVVSVHGKYFRQVSNVHRVCIQALSEQNCNDTILHWVN